MRYAVLLLVACLPLAAGCSIFIASSGKDLSKLTTRDHVHEEFGRPSATDTNEGKSFESYHSREKISNPYHVTYGMGIAMTYGLAELFLFPLELYRLGRTVVVGQEIRFAYDEEGKVTEVFLDGERR